MSTLLWVPRESGTVYWSWISWLLPVGAAVKLPHCAGRPTASMAVPSLGWERLPGWLAATTR